MSINIDCEYSKRTLKKVERDLKSFFSSKEFKKMLIDIIAVDEIGRRPAGHCANDISESIIDRILSKPDSVAETENKNEEIRPARHGSGCVIKKFDPVLENATINPNTMILNSKTDKTF